MMRGRYAYVVLAALSLLVGMACVGFTVSVEHKFCAVVTTFTSVPVPRPADPAANPSREKQFELREVRRARRLARLLGGTQCE